METSSTPTRRRILVTGATGNQGGAVVRALQVLTSKEGDFEILALTRNPSSKKAKALTSDSRVKLIAGDLDHASDIFDQAGGTASVWGVFAVQVPDMKTDPNSDNNKEYRQGVDLIDASIKYGVKHFVQSTVDRGGSRSDSNPTPIAHFITKHRIEGCLRDRTKGSSMKYTILRPVAFMDMFTPTILGRVFASLLGSVGEKPLQLVATKDIGVFAVQAFNAPETDEYKNTAISLAGDELTQEGCNEVFWKVLNRPMPKSYDFVRPVMFWMLPEVGTMFGWFKDEGYGANIQKCRLLNSGMLDLATFLKQESDFRS